MRFVHFKLVGPAIYGLTALIIATGVISWYGAREIDANLRHQQEELVRRNTEYWIEDVEFSITAWTIWDEAIAKLDNTFDLEWADRNIGASLLGTSRARFAGVLDADDKLIYSRMADSVKQDPFFTRGADAIVEQAARLVSEVRSRERTSSPGTGIPDSIAASQIELVGDQPVLLSASLFQPDFRTVTPKGARKPILISAIPLNEALQNFFGSRFLLKDPRLEPLSNVSKDRAHVAVAEGPHGEVEVVSWQAPTPAITVLRQSLPFLVVIGSLVLAGGVFSLRLSRATARMLVTREREMWHAATHDPLTGLGNRFLLDTEFRKLSDVNPTAVAYLDLDGFKPVNDTYGHGAGDELLKIVSLRLLSGVRPTDQVFRLGGDEFAILMPATSADDAEAICRRLSATLADPIILSGAEIKVGASFGVAALSSNLPGYDAALRIADLALYQSKKAGRGLVTRAAPRADIVIPTG